jgi:hypothetical protein
MTITKSTNPERAAAAYLIALTVREQAARVVAEFPKIAATLEAAAKLAIQEGKKAEAGK